MAALRPQDGPQLLFDRGELARGMREAMAAARRAEVRVLFATKSFPHPEVLELAARHLDGFDVASLGELTSVRDRLSSRHVVSVTDPTGEAPRGLPAAQGGAAVIVSCEDAAQVAQALPLAPHARFALRVSSSLLGKDRAIGAVQSGDGHHRSRFGVDVEPARARVTLGEMSALAASHGRPVGLHLHHSGVVPTSAARFVESAQAALALAREGGVTPTFFNLGGAWQGVADQLPEVWLALRAALPDLELLVEPGRLFARGAGFAVGWVRAARKLDDRELRVLDLSRACHLRWSQLELVARAPRPGHGRKVCFVGPTCYEDDLLGEWQVDAQERYEPGAAVMLRHVTGYAVAWNSGFAGVPPATVRFVGDER